MKKETDEDKVFTLYEAADYAHVTHQAMYMAVRYRGLKATKVNRRWFIKKSDIHEYQAARFDRSKIKYNGESLFDIEKGRLSVTELCQMLKDELGRPYCPQRIYYFLRSGKLKAFRHRAAWVIPIEEAQALLDKEKGENPNQLVFA